MRVFGLDVVRDELPVKRLINRVSVDAAFFKKLSPMENLLYAGRLYGLGAAETRAGGLRILASSASRARWRSNPWSTCRAECSRRSRSPARC